MGGIIGGIIPIMGDINMLGGGGGGGKPPKGGIMGIAIETGGCIGKEGTGFAPVGLEK